MVRMLRGIYKRVSLVALNGTYASKGAQFVLQTVPLLPVLPDCPLGDRATGHELQSPAVVTILEPRQTRAGAVGVFAIAKRQNRIDSLTPLLLQKE